MRHRDGALRDPARGQRPRVLFYSHDAYGLCHVRLMLEVARDLGDRRPGATLLALAGSSQICSYDRPPNLDVVTLPPFAHQDRYADLLARGDTPQLGGIRGLRATICERVAIAFAPHLVLVEDAPAGFDGELAPALKALREAKPRPAIVLAIRDILEDPERAVPYLRAQGAYELLDHTYDRIAIYGDRVVFDPIAAYHFPPEAGAKTVFCGYFAPPVPAAAASDVRARLGIGQVPLVVVSTGGGADGGPLIRAYLAALREPELAGVASYVVAGPFGGGTESSPLAKAAAELPGVTFVSFAPDLQTYLHAADAVVSMGGYGTTSEAVAAGKCPVIVPRSWGKEQLLRAESFDRLGLARMIHPDDLTPRLLARTVREELDRTTSPPALLDFGGLKRVGDLLEEALGPRVDRS
jgi:predicted glycosyltransferase